MLVNATEHLLACHSLAWLAASPVAAALLHGGVQRLHETLAALLENLAHEEQALVLRVMLMLEVASTQLVPADVLRAPVDASEWMRACADKFEAEHPTWAAASSALQAACTPAAGAAGHAACLGLARAAHGLEYESALDCVLVAGLLRAAVTASVWQSALIAATHESVDEPWTLAVQSTVCAHLAARDAVTCCMCGLKAVEAGADVAVPGGSGQQRALGARASQRWVLAYGLLQASVQRVHADRMLGQGACCMRTCRVLLLALAWILHRGALPPCSL